MSTALRNDTAAPATLPSGRSVVLRVRNGTEELEVRSPTGAVEVHITLGEDGPVVRLAAARLELAAADTLALNCRRLEVHAEEDLRLTGREMRVQTEGDIHMNGDVIRLNC